MADVPALIRMIESYPGPNAGDYLSHQEVTDALVSVLRDSPASSSVGDLNAAVHSIRRRNGWYEEAVLSNLCLVASESLLTMPVALPLLREQVCALPDHSLSYQALLQVVYRWEEQHMRGDNYTLFTRSAIEAFGDQLAKPADWEWWLDVVDEPWRSHNEPRWSRTLALLESIKQQAKTNFGHAFYRHYMQLHEPDLLVCNLPVTHHRHSGQAIKDKVKRYERYKVVAEEQHTECRRWVESINHRIGEAGEYSR